MRGRPGSAGGWRYTRTGAAPVQAEAARRDPRCVASAGRSAASSRTAGRAVGRERAGDPLARPVQQLADQRPRCTGVIAAAIQVPAIQSCEVTAAADRGRRACDHERARVETALRSSSRSRVRGGEAIAGGKIARVGCRRGWPGPEARDADVVVVGAGLAGLSAAREVRGGRAPRWWWWRRATASGGRVLNEDIGDGKVVEVGGQWIGPTQDRLAALAARARRRDLPHLRRGRERDRVRAAGCSRYNGTIPRINPLVLVDVGAGAAAPQPPGAARAARRALGGARSRAGSTPRRPPPGFAATSAPERAATLLELGVEAVWAAAARGPVAAARALLHPLGGQPRAALRHRRRRAAGPLRRRLPADAARGWPRRSGRSACCSARPCGAIAHGARRRGGDADGAEVRARRAVVAIAPTLAGRIAYDPPLPGHRDQLTQRMPLGTVVKCMAIYDEPFWRADGLSGQATSDAGPVQGHLRQLAARRLARRAARLPRGPPRARSWGGCPQAERRAAVVDCFARLFGPRAARAGALRRAPLGRGGVDPRLLRLPHAHRRLDRLRPRAARADRAASTGPARRRATVWNGYMDGAVSSGERGGRARCSRAL